MMECFISQIQSACEMEPVVSVFRLYLHSACLPHSSYSSNPFNNLLCGCPIVNHQLVSFYDPSSRPQAPLIARIMKQCNAIKAPSLEGLGEVFLSIEFLD
ncbi:MAG TPA: hypothetical protein DIW30_05580 [Bacteroidales bacterium]|nr:hypothetical protein [Bacteroidales bacterium]